jgi:hypothetical protein
MRITKISVKGLFGMFDHEIPLNQESRITIVHGPNGVGKTVLLNMIDALFNFEFQYLKTITFELLCIELQEGTVTDLKSHVKVVKTNNGKDMYITYQDVTEREYTPVEPLNTNDEQFDQAVKEIFPNHSKLRLQGRPFWLQDALYWGLVAKERPTIWPDLLSKKQVFSSCHDLYSKYCGSDTDWFSRICDEITIDTISAQRLIQSGSLEDLADWSDEDQPTTRVFSVFDTIDLHFNSIFGEELWEEQQREVLLFLEIINDRFLFKSASAPKDKDGYHRVVFRSGDNTEIPYETLSSGEQHLMYLYFRLIFGFGASIFSPDHPRLFIIDEPELSMNVVWQRNFLKDLQRIIELRKFDVLIATHSPQIIHDKWDWVVHLGEKVDD